MQGGVPRLICLRIWLSEDCGRMYSHPKWPNSRSFDPILVQNGSKMGPKGGPKMGPQRLEPKKSRKIFFSSGPSRPKKSPLCMFLRRKKKWEKIFEKKMDYRAGCGIRIFRHVWNPPPTEGGQKNVTQNRHTATHLIFWGFGGFLVKKGKKNRPKNGPKRAPKWSKMAKMAPKLAK